MHPIHVLWATPRTTSTAFEWMMRMRGDMACFHEPFGLAWYQGSDARARRG
jgi:adenylylsulfate kinase